MFGEITKTINISYREKNKKEKKTWAILDGVSKL